MSIFQRNTKVVEIEDGINFIQETFITGARKAGIRLGKIQSLENPDHENCRVLSFPFKYKHDAHKGSEYLGFLQIKSDQVRNIPLSKQLFHKATGITKTHITFSGIQIEGMPIFEYGDKYLYDLTMKYKLNSDDNTHLQKVFNVRSAIKIGTNNREDRLEQVRHFCNHFDKFVAERRNP